MQDRQSVTPGAHPGSSAIEERATANEHLSRFSGEHNPEGANCTAFFGRRGGLARSFDQLVGCPATLRMIN